MVAPDKERRLQELDARLKEIRAGQSEGKAHQEEHYSQAQVAWRMVTELVAGLGLGFGIGYGLDSLFGTLPWLMVLFTFLGLAAGVNVMMRTAKEVQSANPADQTGVDERDKDGD